MFAVVVVVVDVVVVVVVAVVVAVAIVVVVVVVVGVVVVVVVVVGCVVLFCPLRVCRRVCCALLLSLFLSFFLCWPSFSLACRRPPRLPPFLFALPRLLFLQELSCSYVCDCSNRSVCDMARWSGISPTGGRGMQRISGVFPLICIIFRTSGTLDRCSACVQVLA